LYFSQPLSVQAAYCSPVIDIAAATVTVDKQTGIAHSFNLTGRPTSLNSAWSERFVRHDLSGSKSHYDENYTGKLNITASFGILFLDGLFGAYDRSTNSPDTDLKDNAFSIRDQKHGLNMDLMTYAMYALANKEPEALLNYTTLVTNANRTLQTFFQHFVRNKLSMTEGGMAFQKIGERMEGLGQAVNENGTAINDRIYPVLNTDRTVEVSVSNRIRVLHMNPLATYLSVGIIIWLIATTSVISCLQRKYTSSMLRNVELLADVMVLVAGSDNFLELVQEKGLALKKNQNVMTKLGWFKGRDGQVRWGVEVVGGRNAVEWVDPPMKVFS
jgi:hypothetical protein